MATWGLHVHRSLGDFSVLSSLLQYEFYVLKIANLDLCGLELVLVSHYLLLFVLRVEQVSHSLNMNFEATHAHLYLLPLLILTLLKSLEDHPDWAWHEAERLLSHAAFHGIGFSSRSLAIGENAHLETIQGASDYVSDLIENVHLRTFMPEDFIKLKLVWLILRLVTVCLGWYVTRCQKLLALPKELVVNLELETMLPLDINGFLNCWLIVLLQFSRA